MNRLSPGASADTFAWPSWSVRILLPLGWATYSPSLLTTRVLVSPRESARACERAEMSVMNTIARFSTPGTGVMAATTGWSTASTLKGSVTTTSSGESNVGGSVAKGAPCCAGLTPSRSSIELRTKVIDSVSR